jgi:hypothetical protein
VHSSDRIYNITIEELPTPNNETDTKDLKVKELSSKQSLESVLKFLEGESGRKGQRTVLESPEEARFKRITPDDITKAKFISNKVFTQKSAELLCLSPRPSVDLNCLSPRPE